MERRLAAILAADMVGYSRLMAADEAGTLTRQNALRKELIDPKITEYGGHLVKSTGDGVLVEFPSVVDALRCAVTIQLAMADHEVAEPEANRIAYRIGINLGDIIVEDGDIYGDGVNVAARLEALAEPGGVCVSRTVVDHVKGRVASDFADQGEHAVKNLPEPIHVFRVLMKLEVAGKPAVVIKPKVLWRNPLVAAATILAVAAMGVAVWQPWSPKEEPAVLESMTQPLPDKPSIAVLPFDNLSGDAEQAYFADGMTDDLITDLSKLSGIFVISRNSTFTYKDKPVKVRQVAEDLGVRYVLEGSVRRVGDEVRINAQLIDALSGFHVWADRYDGSLADVFDLQDKVIGKIVAAMAVSLTASETARSGEVQTQFPAAYDAFLQGLDHYRRNTPDDFAKAIQNFEKAIELDPGYSRAHAYLAAIYYFAVNSKWDVHLGIEYQAQDRAKYHLAKALAQPTFDAYRVSAVYAAASHVDALVELDRAIALEPNNPEGYVTKAWFLTYSGQAAEAEKNARLAMRLNPEYGAEYLRELGRALFFQRRDSEAAEVLERAASRQPDYEFAYKLLAGVYGHLGRIKEATAAVGKYNRLTANTVGEPLTIKEVQILNGKDWLNLDKDYLAYLLEGLRKAGVPEGAVTEVAEIDPKDLVTWAGGVYDVDGAEKIGLAMAMAKALHQRGVTFIDARGAGPYSRGFIPGAINLYAGQTFTKEKLAELITLDEEVVFYCGGEDCQLAPNACAQALVWGYTKVYYFAGGFPKWKYSGNEVEMPQ